MNHKYNERMKRIIPETDDRRTRDSIAIKANDDEGENRTGSTSQTGFMEMSKLIATNLRYEEGKYRRSEDGDTRGSRNETLHKRRTLLQLISLSN